MEPEPHRNSPPAGDGRSPRSSWSRRARAAGLGAAFAGAACVSSYEPSLPLDAQGAPAFEVDSSVAWTSTQIRVRPTNRLEIWADGRVRVARHGPFGWNGFVRSGPQGTYAWYESDAEGEFPLPAGDGGPAPAFALLGRIGADGPPFLVGSHRILRVERTGELLLGINDSTLSDNAGSYRVAVRVGGSGVESVARDARPVIARAGEPNPVADSRVLMIFVDGLRYDVLRELALNDYLPNFKRIFFDGGTDVESTFTIAPANTIPATTACLTGSWPDRTGLFEQLVFQRSAGSIDTLLDAVGPARSARKISEEWWRTPLSSGAERPLLITEWCARAQQTFASTVLPVLRDHPPDLYVQRLANVVPLFGAHRLRRTYADRVQTAFALEQVVRAENRVMAIWYSGVDSAAHETARGLFGPARRELAYIDEDLGRLEERLIQEDIADRTYWVLFADHGSVGGDSFVSRNYDLANDFFFASLADADGDGIADLEGGLGMNVRFQVDDISLARTHEDLAPEHFAVCASQAYSQAWIALPTGSFLSGEWSPANSAAELACYEVHPAFEPVNVLERLLAVRRADEARSAGIAEHPIELVLVPAPPEGVLVLGQSGRAALLERRRRAGAGSRTDEYRFRPVRRWSAGANGVEVEASSDARCDPFGYLSNPVFADLLGSDPTALERWYDDRTWLEWTADSEFPDAVVALTHLLLDDSEAARFDPNERFDALVVAARGWNFGTGRVHPAVHHGTPHREGVHIPFMVAGPNIARGARVTRPARIIDILPTVLDLVRIPHGDADMDGRAVREIWGTTGPPTTPIPVPLTCDAGLPLPPEDVRMEHEALMHDPQEWYDLHNLATDLSGLLMQEIVSMIDGPVDVVLPGPAFQPAGSFLDLLASSYDRLPDSKLKSRPAELIEALRLRHITIGELVNPIQSLQNVDRAVGVVRWGQQVVKDPFLPLGATAAVIFYPVDKALDGAVWLILATRDVLERGLIQLADGTIDGIEGGMRSLASVFSSTGPPLTQRVRLADESP